MLKSSEYKAYSKFIERLAKRLTKFYYIKLNKYQGFTLTETR